jgi:hypothetical protein
MRQKEYTLIQIVAAVAILCSMAVLFWVLVFWLLAWMFT